MARYPFPWDLFFALTRDLPGGGRSLGADSALMVSRIEPAPVVRDIQHAPATGPLMLAANHYQRRGLWIGWPGAVITYAMTGHRGADPAVHWLVTGSLRLFQWRGSGPEVPGSALIFRRVAGLYGMTALPLAAGPGRTRALLHWIRSAESGGTLGVFPEGLRGRSDGLGPPDPGFAELARVIGRKGIPIVPVGIFETDGVLQIRFGPRVEGGGESVMRGIASLLPPVLQGSYTCHGSVG